MLESSLFARLIENDVLFTSFDSQGPFGDYLRAGNASMVTLASTKGKIHLTNARFKSFRMVLTFSFSAYPFSNYRCQNVGTSRLNELWNTLNCD